MEFNNLPLRAFAQHILDRADAAERAELVATANVDHIVEMRRNSEFRSAYEFASIRLLDGVPIAKLAQWKWRQASHKVAGSDLLPAVAGIAGKRSQRIYIVGGMSAVAEAAKDRLEDANPGLIVHVDSPPRGFDQNKSYLEEIAARIRAAQARIIFVCLGAPKQELFVYRNAAILPPGIYVGAGAAVDFAAGNVTRAPQGMQRAGLEWLYRLAKEPRRLSHRYLVRSWSAIPLFAQELRERRVPQAGAE
ncbi:WecB/TagA/CpsF family glycosyltransferase [Cryptosporangium phraense]|uniref:WecB/TagA/CpsF family glycosyltransferase n=1 Tax=Cryptosporangium phraense TaxID=2593070 RepID=A0A545AJ95_9ACTN|nr:WecB/TagA/CpsF family glycosyltransferase [Cryptosporangium phraense]TQS41388.1 WecB/TagA/CpsF family glycosyltransferase [Cryptosporangium phraense]